MAVNDPISDMLTRIRNANTSLKDNVEMPVSTMKVEIARLLKEEGYILDYSVVHGDSFDMIVLDLKYGDDRRRVISGLKRISKPGRRVYAKKDSIPRVLGGLGTAVLSTSKGLMTGRDAEKKGIGGEVVCFIW
ncbi:MAG: 30S ribosomal protein S8 [Actinobacteria bacterium]|nr:30S ribosomal protein S8 [Actinomycetota bacterium]